MSQPPSGAPDGGSGDVPVCPRHPDRVSYIRCQRCRRPVCPECQRSAAVGVQCVDCVREQAKGERPQVTIFGGRAGDGRPMLTMGIIAVCAVVWVAELLSPRVFQEVAFAPALGTAEPWRLITSAFAHSPNQPMHILFNMLALWLVGGYLERMLGWARYLAIYLVTALAGSVTWLLFQPVDPADPEAYVPIVGASGAVFGLFGAMFVIQHRFGRDTSAILGLLAVNLLISFLGSGISWQGHLGGLVTGALVASLYAWAPRERRTSAGVWGSVGIGVVLVAGCVLRLLL